MNILQISTKINLRLNKSASSDYDNFWDYAKQEAFNKAVLEWVRRQKRGKNQTKEGDEETVDRVDDIQFLLKRENLTSRNRGIYNETEKLPQDYLFYKRLTPYVNKGYCENFLIRSHLREEANVDDLLNLPSFKFEETFHTIIGNRINIYHNKDFDINKLTLTYYKLPKVYNFKKLDDKTEFKDDVAELIIDECCKILASDIESVNQKNLAQERNEFNN